LKERLLQHPPPTASPPKAGASSLHLAWLSEAVIIGAFHWHFSGGSLAMHGACITRRAPAWNARRRFQGGSMLSMVIIMVIDHR